MKCCQLVLIITSFLISTVLAKDYYVANNGKENNPGTLKAPFGTIQNAADTMSPGDTCYIRGGVYRETVNLKRSGKEGKFVTFKNYKAEQVVLDGTDLLDGNWEVYKDKIYKHRTDKKIEQLFVDGKMMVEARWPNIKSPDGVFDKNTWAYVDKASLGKLTDDGLVKSGIDWTGGYGVFNISQQMENWVRKVTSQDGNSLTYDTGGITSGLNASFNDDRYYLFGKLEALDFPGEWFQDQKSKTLYLWTKESDSPSGHKIAVKQRDYAFDAKPDTAYIKLEGLHFFGCEFRFQRFCHYITVDDCHLLYPNYSRLIPTMDKGSSLTTSIPQMAGDHLTFQNCTVAHSLMNGIYFWGCQVTAKNNLLHDINWNGSNTFSAMVFACSEANSVYGKGNSIARDNTIYDTGNVAIKFRHPNSIAEYNNLSNGGLSSKDTTLLYTAGTYPNILVQYNWLHDNPGWYGQGLGFRLDGNPHKAQTERDTIRGNVVWNIGGRGFVIKGVNHKVYNNTVLGVINLMYDTHQQTEIYNNYAQSFSFTVDANKNNIKYFKHNITGDKPMLQDPLAYDFSPSAKSPLIDAGTSSRPDYQWAWLGKAPDIGAQERGLIYRKPGYRPIRANQPLPEDKTKNVDFENIKLTWSAPVYEDLTINNDQIAKKQVQQTKKRKSKADRQVKEDSLQDRIDLSYNIYLGTDMQAVGSANESSAEFKTTQTQTSFDPGELAAKTTYYWRVDTLDAKKNVIKFGHIWQFTTGDHSKD